MTERTIPFPPWIFHAVYSQVSTVLPVFASFLPLSALTSPLADCDTLRLLETYPSPYYPSPAGLPSPLPRPDTRTKSFKTSLKSAKCRDGSARRESEREPRARPAAQESTRSVSLRNRSEPSEQLRRISCNGPRRTDGLRNSAHGVARVSVRRMQRHERSLLPRRFLRYP